MYSFLTQNKTFWIKSGNESDKDSLPVEQNNYLSRIVNVYIIYNLDVLPRNPRNNVKLKNCLAGATNVVKNSDKEKSVCKVYTSERKPLCTAFLHRIKHSG